MIYKSKVGDIDLSKVVRLYPAALIDMFGEVAEMSLEWMEMNEEKVKLVHYVLVFDSTPHGEQEKKRVVLEFKKREELMECMRNVSKYYN